MKRLVSFVYWKFRKTSAGVAEGPLVLSEIPGESARIVARQDGGAVSIVISVFIQECGS